MGGRGSGGVRVGSGRKPKEDALKVLHGTATPRQLARTGANHPPTTAKIEDVPIPADLPAEAQAVWRELAPYALAARTLTPGTAFAFQLLCRNVVLERNYANSVNDRGGGNHRGMIQRIDSELARFCLAPFGKPVMTEAPPPADPFDEFDTHTGATH